MTKRSREGEADDISAMANCLMLLSTAVSAAAGRGGDSPRFFRCKTCNRQFSSFQALGGHRASHKKPRLAAREPHPPSPAKPKAHECSICGQEFSLGQALGGHMRRHRAGQNHQSPPPSRPLFLFQVVKKPNSRRVLCPDLNLTPVENQYFSIASSQI